MERVRTKLKDITLLITDGKHGDCNDQESSGYYFISCKDVANGLINYENARQITQKDFEDTDRRTNLQANDIVITNSGTIGRMAIVKDVPITRKTTFQKSVAIIKPDIQKVLPQYLYYNLQYNVVYLINNSVGSAQKNLLLSTLREFALEIHKTSRAQQKIASILSAYDNLIENNNKRIRLLEQMAENLYKEWFVRFRFPGHENVEFENGLPKGWKIWSISKLCDINRKTLNSKNKGLEIEYLDTSSITCNQIVGTESYVFEEAPSRARRIVKHNSIVFSTVRPNLKHYGILKKIPDNLIVSTGFAVFDSKYDIANIIYLFLSSQEVVDYCQLIAEGAVATYPSIKPEEIGRLKIALPNIEIAEKWNGKLESLYSEILNIQKQNTLLARQRDLLLPRLMSGKLEVKI